MILLDLELIFTGQAKPFWASLFRYEDGESPNLKQNDAKHLRHLILNFHSFFCFFFLREKKNLLLLLLLQHCTTLWSGVRPIKFGIHSAFLRKMTSGSRLTPVWSLTPTLHLPSSAVLPTNFGSYRAFLNNLTPTWPWLTPAWPLIPAMCNTQWGVLSKTTWPLNDLRPFLGFLPKYALKPRGSVR